jgi:purine-cytosine permease-like protein
VRVRRHRDPGIHALPAHTAELHGPDRVSPPVLILIHVDPRRYWLAIYEGIALTEHFLFRRNTSNYRPEDYNSPKDLPPGIAAVIAFCCGVAGTVVGMDQVWYTGVVAKFAGGSFGGDVGFELAFLFASTSYAVLRTFEKRYFGR